MQSRFNEKGIGVLHILLTRLSAPPLSRYSILAHGLQFGALRHLARASISPAVDFAHWRVNCTQWNNTDRHFLYPPEELMLSRPLDLIGEVTDTDGELAAKLWFSLRFFLENTTAHWFYRGNDDSLVNFKAIERFLERLESAHNPLRDFVFLGNCIRNEYWTCPQGGSGYVLSRAGAEALAPLGRQFISLLKKSEDIAFEAFF